MTLHRCQFKDEADKSSPFSFPNLSAAGGSRAGSAGATRSSSYNGDGAPWCLAVHLHATRYYTSHAVDHDAWLTCVNQSSAKMQPCVSRLP